ncbi:condensation domain-containing protein, partial [Noviherbaspirillum sp. CPCC 100848]
MFSKNDIKDIRALTPMQRGMLHHALLDPHSHAYHEQLVLRIDGRLDPQRLETAWQRVVDAQDALRGRFLSERVSNPVHVIPHHEKVTLVRHTVADVSRTAAPDALPVEVEAFLACDKADRFDLANAHPMRVALFSAPDGQHWMVWSFHHILLDGWSIGIVLQQLRAFYDGSTPAEPNADYTRYLQWLVARDTNASLQYWQSKLTGFSTDGLRQAASAGTEAHATATVDGATLQTLRALLQTQRVSMHHLLLCGWALCLGRYLDRRDVIVPTVLAGRPADIDHADRLVGLMINTVPMRVSWNDTDTVIALLQKVRDDSLEAARHQYISMADIQSATGRLPIDHVLLVQGMPGQDVLGQGIGEAAIGWAGFRESIPYGLEISLSPTNDGISISLRGNHDAAFLQGLADSLRAMLSVMAANPYQLLRDTELVDDAQRSRLQAWGDGGPAAPHGSILQAFDAQAASSPEAIAIAGDGGELSYRELSLRANCIARALHADGGFAPDTAVALVSRRDAGLVAGLLGILRAGGAYVPVDPDFPAERIRQMLEGSGCRHVLASSDLAATLPALPGVRVLHLEALLSGTHGTEADSAADNAADTAPRAAITPDSLAYVIFTSGSTGTPKGAML